MHSFTTVFTAIVGFSAIASAAAVPAKSSGLVTVTSESKNPRSVLSKREPVTAAILTAAGTAAVTAVVNAAVKAATDFIGDISNFDSGREAFTKQTTDAMMAQNPDPARFVAAICYNQDFDVADRSRIDGESSVEFRLGLLNTDYSCLFMEAPNQFFTFGDGGFINLSATHTDRCTFDSATADLTCV